MYNAQFVSALKEALKGLRVIHSVGEEWHSYIGQIPVGGVPYCGQEVTRETYSALWSYAQAQGLVISEAEWQIFYTQTNGNVPLYSEGDGSTTFRMPRIVGYVRGASIQDEAGGHFAEGLPNIEAKFHNGGSKEITNNPTEGAFYTYANSSLGNQPVTSSTGTGLGFDASRSNPIYGNSEHVIPETSCVLFGVYAFGEVSNVDSLDATTLASALARVESNLTRIESSIPAAPVRYVVETWRDGKQWYTKYNDGWIEQGGLQPNLTLATTVTLNTPFTTTDYTVTGGKNNGEGGIRVGSLTTTSFGWSPSGATASGYWRAEGY